MTLRSIYHKGFFHLLSVNFLGQALGFGSLLFVAKFLTPVELGQIKILQSYTGIFVVLAGFGINTAVVKICSEGREMIEKKAILRLALLRSLIFIVIAVVVLSSLALGGLITSSQHLAFWLVIYSFTIPFAVFTDILTAFLQSLKKIKELARVQGIIRCQFFVVIVISTWQWGFEGFVFSTVAAYLAGLLPLLRHVGLKFLTAKTHGFPEGFAHIALFSVLANGANTLGQYGDIIILDHFSNGRSEIGYYSLATIFLMGARQVTYTVQSIATPYFSEGAQDEVWFRRKLIETQARMIGLSMMVAIGVYALAWALVEIMYGPTYHSTLTYLPILLLKYVFWSSCAVVSVAMLGLGLTHYNFVAVAVSTPVGLILSYMLLERFGVSGVAWGQVAGALVNLVLVLLLGWQALRRNLRQNSTKK